LKGSILREQNKPTASFGLTFETWRTLILSLWVVLICCVVIGSLLPAASPVMIAIGRLQIWDKLQHFGAYLALSFLPVIGFKDRRKGLMAGLTMFFLGILMEAASTSRPGVPPSWATSSPTVQASVVAPCWAFRSAP
jgi:hypothetical protein